MTLKEAVINLLLKHPGQYIDRGFGQFSCASCGASKSVDYGDNDMPMTEEIEEHSKSCPWRLLRDALENETSSQE